MSQVEQIPQNISLYCLVWRLLMALDLDLTICARQKREDDCPSCNAMSQTPELLLREFFRKEKCLSKNIVVCRNCTPGPLTGLTYHTWRGDFEAWCFDYGDFENKVAPCLCKLSRTLKQGLQN